MNQIDHNRPEIVDDQETMTAPALTLDYALYEQYLENSGLSDDEKQAFLETLWSIIVSFVDLGFGVHPLQTVCEEKRLLNELITQTEQPVLEQKTLPPTITHKTADQSAQQKGVKHE